MFPSLKKSSERPSVAVAVGDVARRAPPQGEAAAVVSSAAELKGQAMARDSHAEALQKEHGHWGAHAQYPVADWQHAVANGDTRLGYWPWVAAKIDAAS